MSREMYSMFSDEGDHAVSVLVQKVRLLPKEQQEEFLAKGNEQILRQLHGDTAPRRHGQFIGLVDITQIGCIAEFGA